MNNNVKRVAAIVLQAANAWPHIAGKMTAGTAAIYAQALADIPAEAVEVAYASLLRTSQWYPSVAQVRQEAEAYIRLHNGTVEQTADEAWGEVMRALRAWPHHNYQLPELVKTSLARCGGLTKLANSEETMLPAYQTQFRRIYEIAQKRQKDNERIMSVIAALPAVRQDKLLR